jgi:hypothetical protein
MEFVKKHFVAWLRLEQLLMFLLTVVPLLYYLLFTLMGDVSSESYMNIYEEATYTQFWIYANLVLVNVVLKRSSDPFFLNQSPLFAKKTKYFWFLLAVNVLSEISSKKFWFLFENIVNLFYWQTSQEQASFLNYPQQPTERWLQFLLITFVVVSMSVGFKYIPVVRERFMPPEIEVDISSNMLASADSQLRASRNPGDTLKLYGYGTPKMPVGIQSWRSLRYLDLSYNNLTQDVYLWKLPNLENLNLSHNQVIEISKLGELPKLHILDLSYNPYLIGGSLPKFPELRHLNLSNCNIRSTPSVDQFRKLEHLDLHNNMIHNFDIKLKKLPKLKYLSLQGNPIRNIPEDIVELPNCADALRAYQAIRE